MKRNNFLALAFLLLIAQTALGQVSKTLSYQGLLTDAAGEVVSDGDYNISFALYDVTEGGASLWSEDTTLTVQGGVFSAVLGTTNDLNLAFDKPYWLGITVNGGEELAPRIQLTASAYSMNALSVNGDVLKVEKKAVYFPYSRITDKNGRMGIDPYNNRMILWDSENSMSFEIYHGKNDLDVRLKAGGENSWISGVNKGNLGIGTKSPQKLLDVNGDAHVRGKITSGDANVSLPIAYAYINADASIASGTSNVTDCSWDEKYKRYDITISGDNYTVSDYVTVASPRGGSADGPIMISVTDTGGGKLRIYIWNLSGERIQKEFQFVTYKP